jgi:hypothetical protein
MSNFYWFDNSSYPAFLDYRDGSLIPSARSIRQKAAVDRKNAHNHPKTAKSHRQLITNGLQINSAQEGTRTLTPKDQIHSLGRLRLKNNKWGRFGGLCIFTRSKTGPYSVMPNFSLANF